MRSRQGGAVPQVLVKNRIIEMKSKLIILQLLLLSLLSRVTLADQDVPSSQTTPIKIGVASILSGDLALLGRNIVDTVESYKKHFARHSLEFVVEDAKLSSMDGLGAYQKLIAS